MSSETSGFAPRESGKKVKKEVEKRSSSSIYQFDFA